MVQEIWKKHESDFGVLEGIETLGGMSNQNFKISTNLGTYFLRLEKINKSDSQYGGNFEKEYNISKKLSLLGIAPKIYYFGNIGENQYIIQEYIIDDSKEVEISSLGKKISLIQDFNIQEFDFLSQSTVYDLYQKKFKTRFFHGSELLIEYKEIQGILEKTKNRNEKLVLCHGDLRRDNIISNEENIYVIDWEGAYICDEAIDIVGYYMGNVFFEIEEYSQDKYNLYKNNFSNISEDIFKIYGLLQFFSDLTWLENYIAVNSNDIDKRKLFEKNQTFFRKLLKQLD